MPAMTAPPTSDAELVTAARAGDDRAFAALVARHETRALTVARALVRHAHDADDVVQDAFVRAHRNLDLLADPARFGAWLGRVVVGVAIDWLRAHATERRLVLADGGVALATAPAVDDAHAAIERRERAERVLAAVHALPERYRVPLSLYHLDGLSHARIADTLGVPAGTVRSLVTRARERLRADLASLAPDSMTEPTDDPFAERPTPRLLHILNGDSLTPTLARSGVPGASTVWADALHDGPVLPFDVGEARRREVRAAFIERAGWATREEALRTAERWDAGVAAAPTFDEAVIWCEHDLFDQLLLIRHLAWFAERPADEAARTTLSLVCIGAWPGMPHFKGLGELGPSELASLLGTRQRVTQRQIALGRRAWRAFTGDDPRAIERVLVEEDTASLPFLAAALRRFLEELPETRDGLARTDRAILRLVADGVTRPVDAWTALHRAESNYYIGDASYLNRLRALAAAPHPLLELALGAERWHHGGTLALTDVGRDVLALRADAVVLRGIDDWFGGVHLVGTHPRFRWDAAALRVVAS